MAQVYSIQLVSDLHTGSFVAGLSGSNVILWDPRYGAVVTATSDNSAWLMYGAAAVRHGDV